jgi:hypothetical protein
MAADDRLRYDVGNWEVVKSALFSQHVTLRDDPELFNDLEMASNRVVAILGRYHDHQSTPEDRRHTTIQVLIGFAAILIVLVALSFYAIPEIYYVESTVTNLAVFWTVNVVLFLAFILTVSAAVYYSWALDRKVTQELVDREQWNAVKSIDAFVKSPEVASRVNALISVMPFWKRPDTKAFIDPPEPDSYLRALQVLSDWTIDDCVDKTRWFLPILLKRDALYAMSQNVRIRTMAGIMMISLLGHEVASDDFWKINHETSDILL